MKRSALNLLPCPFCGEQPKFTFNKDHKPEITESYWSLACRGKKPLCTGHPMSFGATKKEAAGEWNKRTHSLTPGIIFCVDELIRCNRDDAAAHLLHVTQLGAREAADQLFIADAIASESLHPTTITALENA